MKSDPVLDGLLDGVTKLSDLELLINAYLAFMEVPAEPDEGTTALWILRQQTRGYGGIRIEVRPKEQCHNLAHFHVIGPDVDASFSIPDGRQLAGQTLPRGIRRLLDSIVEKKKCRKVLIKEWNDSRPSDCPIGKI